MTIVDDIVALLADWRRPLTSKEIVQLLYGKERGYPQRVDGRLNENWLCGKMR
jgi:hypothetical protein